MIIDYHVHTPYCGHAKGKIIDYVHSAIAAGLQEIGFSDHLGRYYLTETQKRRYWDWGMAERDLARYVADLLDIREVFQGRIGVKIGLEVDYVEGAEELIGPMVDHFPFDYLLGSVHCLPQLGWKHLANYGATSDTTIVYKEYFRVALALLRSGVFNALAHPDFIWRYVEWPRETQAPFEGLAALAKCAAETGHAIEINANAFHWSKDYPMENNGPFDFLLDRIKERHVPVTMGSDAHEPGMVGKSFPEIIALLKEKGISSMVSFQDGDEKTVELG
jgi:histidinol-phosphatase (PHP family)